MFIMGNFINAIAHIIDIVLTIYMWIIIGRAVISWVNPDPYNSIVQFLYRATEPTLGWVRRKLPVSMIGGMDISPILVILAIYFAQSFVVSTLAQIAHRMG